MAKTQDNSKPINNEFQHIAELVQARVEATSGELDDRIKAARGAHAFVGVSGTGRG